MGGRDDPVHGCSSSSAFLGCLSRVDWGEIGVDDDDMGSNEPVKRDGNGKKMGRPVDTATRYREGDWLQSRMHASCLLDKRRQTRSG